MPQWHDALSDRKAYRRLHESVADYLTARRLDSSFITMQRHALTALLVLGKWKASSLVVPSLTRRRADLAEATLHEHRWIPAKVFSGSKIHPERFPINRFF